MSARADYLALMSASGYAAKQMRHCVPGGERWRELLKMPISLAEQASLICDDDQRAFSWERKR